MLDGTRVQPRSYACSASLLAPTKPKLQPPCKGAFKLSNGLPSLKMMSVYVYIIQFQLFSATCDREHLHLYSIDCIPNMQGS